MILLNSYQGWADLRTIQSVEQVVHFSLCLSNKWIYSCIKLFIYFYHEKHTKNTIKNLLCFQVSESSLDGPLRRVKSRENVAPSESGKSSILSRSRSLDYLPPREISGTKALCALFESKANLQQDLSSSPWLNSAAITGSKTGGDYPLQDRRSHNTPVKTKTTQVCKFRTSVLFKTHE